MRTILGPLGFSLAAIIAVVVALGIQIPSLVGSVFVGGVSDSAASSRLTTLVARHDAEADLYSHRWIGRSVYFTPPAPPPEPVSRDVQAPPPPEPRTDPAPATYAGPLNNPNCILGDQVWFPRGNDKVILRIGETIQGVRLVSVNPPYSATVAWTAPPRGHVSYEEGLYELTVFEKFVIGPNSPFLSEPPDTPIQIQGLESTPAGSGLQGPPGGPGSSSIPRPNIRRPGEPEPPSRSPQRGPGRDDEDD